MERPNLDNVMLRRGEREELERLFDYTQKLREEMRRDPEVARALLRRIGYYEMMEDERAEQEALSNGAQANGAQANGAQANGHSSNGSSSDGEHSAA